MRQPIPFGKYLLLDRISVGGMAEVFKAKSYGVEGFEKVIAIKRILPSMGEDRDFIKMFIDEAKIVGQLAHANICQIFELGRIDGAHFIAMEYIWGRDLLQIHNRVRKKQQTISVPMACYNVAKVCEGLDYAHKKRDPMGAPLEIVHRDCSPQNILISYEGEVKIIDFGIAKAKSRSSRTMAGVLKGKFGYMSPEQVRGLPLDRRSDIFSLGTILYESLTGSRLFQGESDFSTLEKVRNVDIQPPSSLNSDISPTVEAIVMKALEADVDKRYQWCSEMQADLQKYLMSQEQVFTAKSLASWMKETFEAELARERKLMEQYKSVGRDGLVAEVPQAQARLDVNHEFGGAGEPEGEPTILGGPNFEELLSGGAGAPPAAAALDYHPPADDPLAALPHSDDDSMDFADEAPTETYGEAAVQQAIVAMQGAAGDRNALAVARTMLDSRSPFAGPASGGEGAATPMQSPPDPSSPAGHQPAGAGYAGPARLGPPGAYSSPYGHADSGSPSPHGHPRSDPSGSPGYAGAPGYHGGPGIPQSHFDEPFYGTTSSVPPLPSPGAADSPERQRSFLVRDIAIGVIIAVLVLGLFAAGKFFFFSDEDNAGPRGEIVVSTADDGTPATILLSGKVAGEASSDAPLTLSGLALGIEYRVKVVRPGFVPCEYTVPLSLADPDETLKCELEPIPPPAGTLVLEGLTAEHSVFVDGKRVPGSRSGKPLELSASQPHSVVVKRGERTVEKFTVELAAGQEERRAITDERGEEEDTRDHDTDDPDPPDRNERDGDPGDERDRRDRDKASRADAQKSSKKRTGRGKRQARERPREAESEPEETVEPVETLGYLVASSNPWARIFIDGRDTGKSTPISKSRPLELEPGRHKVTFQVGRKRFHYFVTIEPGKVANLSENLPVE